MRHLLVESKVGGQYCQIVSRIKGAKFLYDENCLILDVTKSKTSEFVVVFPFSYDFLIKSEREQHGKFGYVNLISIFFKNKFKYINLKRFKVSLVSSRYKLKNQVFLPKNNRVNFILGSFFISVHVFFESYPFCGFLSSLWGSFFTKLP